MSERLLHQWKSFQLKERQQTLPTGDDIAFTYLDHPGAVVILPINAQGQLLLLKQYRPALQDWIYELPAGCLEQGETALVCAQREIVEEAGVQAKQWHAMGPIHPTPGFCNEVLHAFVACELTSAFAPCDEDEVIEVIPVSPTQFEQWVLGGKITDAKTLALYFHAKLKGLIPSES